MLTQKPSPYTYTALSLDLMAALKVRNGENGIKFNLDQNGKNYPTFNVDIRRLTYPAKASTPVGNTKHGVWMAGFKEKELIKWDKKNDANKTDNDLTEHLAHTVFRIVTFVVSPAHAQSKPWNGLNFFLIFKTFPLSSNHLSYSSTTTAQLKGKETNTGIASMVIVLISWKKLERTYNSTTPYEMYRMGMDT